MSPLILVVEDGDEYLNVLTRFVPQYRYLQAHDGHTAATLLAQNPISLVYLDMRFDRIHRELLIGDHRQQTEKFGGNEERAWKFLEKNQGIFILNHLCTQGFADIPMTLSHDFSGESVRWKHLSSTYANLTWLPDTVTPTDLINHFNGILSV